jgi:hypothetical protein
LAIGLAIIVAIVVALALIANGFMAWRTERRLQAKIAAIQAAGDPASIADLAPEPIPDDQNAAFLLVQIGPRLDEFAKEHARFFETPVGKAYDEARDKGELPTPEQIEAIRAIVAKYPDLDRDIAQLTALEQYASQADFSLDHRQFLESAIDQVQDVRTAARFLGWQMEVLVAEGKPEQAAELGLQMLRLARLYEAEPALINFLVAIAIRGIAAERLYDALAAGPISPELHAALDEELARNDDPQRLERVLKDERAVCIDGFETLMQGCGSSGCNPAGGSISIDGTEQTTQGMNPFLIRLVGWPVRSYGVGVLDALDEQLALAAHPWEEIRDQFGPANAPPPSSGHGVLADLLVPALKAAFQAHARSVALSRALRIDNALRQFAEKNGREAKGLEDLDLPKEAMIDPYSGQPLKLKHTEDGWLIYSVMENGIDDGGDFKELKDCGLAPPGKWRGY